VGGSPIKNDLHGSFGIKNTGLAAQMRLTFIEIKGDF